MEELLTLKEIAARLGVPESNLRYYRNRVGDFLPSVGEGRRRRYFPEAAEVLRRTVELVSQGVSLDRVYKYLAAEQPPEIESVGAISQDAFAEKVAEKIFERIGKGAPAGDAGGGDNTLKERVAELKSELERARTRAVELEKAEVERGRVEELAKGLQAETGRLKDRLEELAAENATLKNRFEEKEKIVELQKAQLIDARTKRLNIEQELGQIRAMIESIAGVRAQ